MYHDYDMFKAYPLRYCGYGYGIAEALTGPVGHPWTRAFYLMATGFIFAHTIHRPLQKSRKPVKMAVYAGDTFIYEAIASGIIPVFTAHTVKRAVSTILHAKSSPGPLRLWGPAVCSLLGLQIVIPPADYCVDYFMDHTIRKLYF